MPKRNLDSWYYHVYNRWFEKMFIYKDKQDFQRFYELVIRYEKAEEFNGIKILSYCFLPNHFHFIIFNPGVELSIFMWRLQNAYGKYFNMKYKRKWMVFEGRFKAKYIDTDEYLEQCIQYVNFNPLKHEIVTDISHYPWTSYHQLTEEQREQAKDNLILSELEY